jgi:hypothetical protein
MRVDVSSSLLAAGGSNEPAGTHTTRTLMLDELRTLLAFSSPNASYEEYAGAILDENALRKATISTRRKTLRHLRELYALRRSVPLFAALRALWNDDVDSQPLLALICAEARDPLVRCTIELVADTPSGSPLTAQDFQLAVAASFPDRFSPGVRSRIGRNLASTWTQSGHLGAASRSAPKERQRLVARPPEVVYALYVGHLDGQAGPGLFGSPWAKSLDTNAGNLRTLAETAARRGWIDIASSGGMLEVGFSHLDGLVRGTA